MYMLPIPFPCSPSFLFLGSPEEVVLQYIYLQFIKDRIILLNKIQLESYSQQLFLLFFFGGGGRWGEEWGRRLDVLLDSKGLNRSVVPCTVYAFSSGLSFHW